MILLLIFLSLQSQTYADPPSFTQAGLDPVVDLYEYTNSITELASLECVDTVDMDDVIVKLDSVTPQNGPCSTCFQVYPRCGSGTGSNDFCVKFLPSGSFDYDRVREYSLRFSCSDVNGETASPGYTVFLRLIPNTPPTFISSVSVTATVANTENIKAGGSVYKVTCTDPDSDTLQYTVSTDPITTNLFRIDSNGVIYAESDLISFCRSYITFSVTCRDPYNPAVGPVNIQATLDGANQQPTVTGINYNKDIPEDTAVGTSLATFTVTEANTCQLFASPTESLQYFDLDSSQRSIIVKKQLDYEQVSTRNTNLTVTCTDGFCTSNPSYVYIRVTDVNEPIELFPENPQLETYEGNIDLDPKWAPLDPDDNDNATYTIIGGSGSGLFSINSDTGRITSTREYDIDGGIQPTTQTIVVQAKDRGGHSSSTTLTLSIRDSNDNSPTFSNAQTYSYTVQDCTGPGTSPGSVVATDADSSFQDNNVINYSGSSSPLTVAPNGAIIVGSNITAGTTYFLTVTATDRGQYPSPLTSVQPAVVTVTVTACPTSTTVTTTTTVTTATTTTTTAATNSGSGSGSGSGAVIDTSEASSADSLDENLGWIVVAGILGTVAAASLAYMVWKYCYQGGFCEGMCADMCVSRAPAQQNVYYTQRVVTPPARPVREVKEVRVYRGPQPEAGNPGFWQERYPDDDYNTRDPMRSRVPTPADYEVTGNTSVMQNYQPNVSWRNGRALAY